MSPGQDVGANPSRVRAGSHTLAQAGLAKAGGEINWSAWGKASPTHSTAGSLRQGFPSRERHREHPSLTRRQDPSHASPTLRHPKAVPTAPCCRRTFSSSFAPSSLKTSTFEAIPDSPSKEAAIHDTSCLGGTGSGGGEAAGEEVLHRNQSILRSGSLHRGPAGPGRLCRNAAPFGWGMFLGPAAGVASAPSSAVAGIVHGGRRLAAGRRCPACCPACSALPLTNPARGILSPCGGRPWGARLSSASRLGAELETPGRFLPPLAQERCRREPLLNPGHYQPLKQRGSGGCIRLCHGSGLLCRASAGGGV